MSYSLAERAYLALMSGAAEHLMATPPRREVYELARAVVTAVEDVAPQVRRLTLRSEHFREYTRLGADEYFGLVMPRPDRPLVLPEGNRLDLRKEIIRMPEQDRPDLRWYTIRAHRPAEAEVDVDIVIHEGGPGGAFLRLVRPGDEVGFREGTGGYRAPVKGERHLLVADEAAFPALSAMADHVQETVGSTDAVIAYVELPTPDHAARIQAPFEIIQVCRGEGDPGSAVLPLVAEADTTGVTYAWVCGEQSLAAAGRRHLVKECGLNRRSVLFSGYWRRGAARP
ncbi:siderophore-interacting protein [Austwickia chelonae]|uniref:siderophore-interacting protein n=1 Tax=Austwickia chelonae TaxID=100225 RepID=UPI000E2749E9|nr:siderophore-interacting protein [Austwickia chelonae]